MTERGQVSIVSELDKDIENIIKELGVEEDSKRSKIKIALYQMFYRGVQAGQFLPRKL